LPDDYLALLDGMVQCAVDRFGLPAPDKPLLYLYYPAVEELQKDVLHRYGGHVTGLTERGDGNHAAVIRTAYPGHVHEVMHALLLGLNSVPNFFVAEASATLLGTCWGSQADLEETPVFQEEIRAVDRNGQRISLDDCLICDNKGLLCGSLRRHNSVHDVARFLVQRKSFRPNLASWFDATNESCLPGSFYQIGGSFFLWLIEVYGAALFRDFYCSRQTASHLQEYFRTGITELENRWLDFLTAGAQ
jgi:hypothetical protein